jgi:hypothetical protein
MAAGMPTVRCSTRVALRLEAAGADYLADSLDSKRNGVRARDIASEANPGGGKTSVTEGSLQRRFVRAARECSGHLRCAGYGGAAWHPHPGSYGAPARSPLRTGKRTVTR